MRIGIDASRAFVENPTGTERYSFEVITRLLALPEARKHSWILYVRPNFKFKIFNLNSNFKFQIINFQYLWTQLGLAWRTWRDGLDVLWIPAHTLPVLCRPGIRTVVTIHGLEYEWLPEYENLLQRWYLPLSTEYAVHSAEKIIAVSEFTRGELVRRLGADESKIEVVHEGCTLPTQNRQSRASRAKLKTQNYLLFVGTVQPRKNLVRLIRAVIGMKIKLVIAGKLGWNYREVVDLAKKHGVMITGYINEAERHSLLRNALVYVQPSITEGFGLPVLEAMAAGVPVVSSNGGALAEIVGDAGLLFDPYDVKDIGHKLSLACLPAGRSLRKELIKRGKERIKKFSWDLTAKRTYKILISKH